MTMVQPDASRKIPGQSGRPPFTERGALRLLVQRDSFYTSCASSLRTILALAHTGSKSRHSTNYFLRNAHVSPGRVSRRSVAVSVLLHCSAVALLVYLPQAIPASASVVEAESAPTHVQMIYYRIPLDESSKLPRITPKPATTPPAVRNNTISVHLPALASTVQHPNITIVSSPAHPDNFRQTIYQPTSPPDLRIVTDQKLPNIVMGQDPHSLNAPLDPTLAHPSEASRQLSNAAAPSVQDTSKQQMMAFLKTSDSPQLTIPVSGGGAPIQRAARTDDASGAKSADSAGLILLGIDPAAAKDQFSLPAGNRFGQFSIAPPPASNGSPDGDPHAEPSKVTSVAAPSAKATAPNPTGAAGTSSATERSMSIAGPNAGGEGGALDPTLPVNMIYPVAAPPLNIRRNTMVISAGPMGGGGLSVYGALQCGKIYSVFLPMPGRNWSMQYCDSSAKPSTVSSEGYTTVLKLDNPLAPPDVDMTHRFDFKRIPLPVDKAHRSIILKGVISTTGTVQNLAVYQGVQPQMDDAAKLAFSRWHFRPATRDGKPVAVEILVGIPPESGEDRVSR